MSPMFSFILQPEWSRLYDVDGGISTAQWNRMKSQTYPTETFPPGFCKDTKAVDYRKDSLQQIDWSNWASVGKKIN